MSACGTTADRLNNRSVIGRRGIARASPQSTQVSREAVWYLGMPQGRTSARRVVNRASCLAPYPGTA